MKHLIILATLLLAAPATAGERTDTCDREVELRGPGWTATACVDDGPRELFTAIDDAAPERLTPVQWCVTTDDLVECGEVRNSAHPWCSPTSEDPSYCDGVCCMLTIINGACGGCLDPTPDDDGAED